MPFGLIQTKKSQ